MSGVFGCWQLDGRPIDPIILRQCLIQISPQGSHAISAWTGAHAALGCKGAGASSEPDTDRDTRTVETPCVFDGRLDNRDELLRVLASHPRIGPGCEDRDLLFAAYHQFGDTFVDHLAGDFVAGLFDTRTNRLLIARDRLGLRPVCYTESNGAFLFASEAKALLAYPNTSARPDEIMLADFVLSFRAADSQTRTFFDGIHSLPAAHLLIATPTSVSVRRYFDFDTTRSIRLRTFHDYAGAYRELFAASVTKRLRCSKPVAISVSGGLDSAYIFAVAQRAMREGKAQCPGVVGVNYAGASGTPSEEERFVAALEQATGASIHRIPQRSGFIECAGDEVGQAESPVVEGLACQGQAVLGRVRETGAGRFLTGHWGDQLLSDADYLLDLVRSGRWRAARRHSRAWRVGVRELTIRFARDAAARHLSGVADAVRRARRRQTGAWCAPWYTDRFRHILRERTLSRGMPRGEGTSHARAIHLQSRLGYHVQCMEWNARVAAGHGVDVAFPYLDADLIQFLMSIPGEVQSHDGISRGLMRQAMRGVVPDTIIDRRSKGEFTHLINKSIDDDFPAILDLLGPAALSVSLGFVNGPVLWSLLPQWRNTIRDAQDAVLSNRVIDLCGFEMLLRRFFWSSVAPSVPLEASVVPR